MLNNYDIAAIIAFCALLMSLAFWLTLKMRWLPSLKKGIIKEAPEIGKKTWELIKDDIPDIKEEFKKELPAMIEAFKKELPDIKKDIIPMIKEQMPDIKEGLIPLIKEEIIPIIKEEFENSNIVEDFANGFLVKLQEEDKVTLELIGKISSIAANVAVYMVMNDPKLQERINGYLVQKGNTVFKTFEGKIQKMAAGYGIGPGGEGQEGLPGMNPEGQKLMQKAMKMYAIWNEK